MMREQYEAQRDAVCARKWDELSEDKRARIDALAWTYTHKREEYDREAREYIEDFKPSLWEQVTIAGLVAWRSGALDECGV